MQMVKANVTTLGRKVERGNLGHKSWPENLIGLGIGQAGVTGHARTPPDLRPAPRSPLLADHDRKDPKWQDGLGSGSGWEAGESQRQLIILLETYLLYLQLSASLHASAWCSRTALATSVAPFR